VKTPAGAGSAEELSPFLPCGFNALPKCDSNEDAADDETVLPNIFQAFELKHYLVLATAKLRFGLAAADADSSLRRGNWAR
jgi:hypothetical protein